VRPDRVFFLHIAKTGGVSVETLIRNNIPTERINPGGPDDFIGTSDWPNIDRYKYHFSHQPLYLRSALPGPLWTFTFLRDPVDRLVSAYNHILRDPRHRLHAVVVGERIEPHRVFEHPDLWTDFTEVYTRILGCRIDHVGAVPARADISGWLQTLLAAHRLAWQSRPDQSTAERAMQRLAELDFIGFTETFERDCRRLAQLLGFKPGPIPRENSTPADIACPRPVAVRTPRLEAATRQHCANDYLILEQAHKIGSQGRFQPGPTLRRRWWRLLRR
jgi:hypothetical protein